MKIGKDKVYSYYKLFKQVLIVEHIYIRYQMNKKKCGRKPIVLSVKKLKDINQRLDLDWSLDAISGRDKINEVELKHYTTWLKEVS